MKKLFVCALIFTLTLTQARAAEEQEQEQEQEEEQAPVSSAYISLGEPMILNLSGSKRLTFLQLSADVLISDADEKRAIKAHLPAIRHSLIMLLSEQKADDIKSPTKREEIRKQATARVKGLIAELSGSRDISDVLFSSILVQ